MPDFFGEGPEGGRKMVKVTNGRETVTVSRGAFECILSRRGFWPVEQESVISANAGITKPELLTASESAELHNLEADEKWAVEQCQKPLSAWGQKELKRFAKIRGIKLEGVKSAKEAREIVAKFLQ